MPEKRHAKGCGKTCIRCWVNRQKHGNKLKKKFFPKCLSSLVFSILWVLNRFQKTQNPFEKLLGKNMDFTF